MQQLSGAPVPFTLHRNYELRSVPFRSLVPFLEMKVRKCRTSNETRISIIKLLHRGRVMSPFKYMPLIYIPSQEDRAKASRCERIKQGGLRSAKEKYNRQRIPTMNGNLWGKINAKHFEKWENRKPSENEMSLDYSIIMKFAENSQEILEALFDGHEFSSKVSMQATIKSPDLYPFQEKRNVTSTTNTVK